MPPEHAVQRSEALLTVEQVLRLTRQGAVPELSMLVGRSSTSSVGRHRSIDPDGYRRYNESISVATCVGFQTYPR